MPAEWPIAAPPPRQHPHRPSLAFPASEGRRIAAVVQDLFLAPDDRLTEQERSVMAVMLHGLIERIAIELRVRLSAEAAADCTASPAELIADLTRAGLIQDEMLIRLLLRRADGQRIASAGRGGRSTLQRWTAVEDADIAAAAMTLIAARGRGRDRFGRVALDLPDLPAALATGLVVAIGAALALRCQNPSDAEMADAISDLLSSRFETPSLEQLEGALADALGGDGRREPGLLMTLAEEGDAQILAAILAAEACIPADEAWSALLGGPDRIALLLRLAGAPRPEVAALLAAAGPALGIGDPVRAIDAFDAMSNDTVEAARAELALPGAYRNARRIIGRRG
ncbi:DUF2336 domain-containing protein [Sphingomonas glaciei]|uniref:DUF2336 domain-containing protein n=1 Tax=Sphingomonas glaciei TaxID=2938948 RepID=A0ABY5MYF1_9SPHN|nr:DUF2336 domain-containing protein [Sphingomonas glaciei]UUR09051.1 DUF2336 domain-containing protein [Sphingomonas glaciei]